VLISALTVTGLVAGAGLAAASRAPTHAERQSLAAAVGMPPSCIRVRISQRASVPWARVSPTNSRGCPGSNGVIVFQEGSTLTWRLAFQGPDDIRRCPIRGIPNAVSLDLNLCLAPSRRVFAISLFRLVWRPRMITYGAHAALTRLSWRGWGTRSATATGVIDYADRFTRFRLPVRVTLSQIGFCRVNQRTYRRQTVTATRASDRRRLHYLTGTERLFCPGEFSRARSRAFRTLPPIDGRR
jgi:hypothetical protein